MRKKYEISSKTLIESGLSPNYFLLLQSVFFKDEEMTNYILEKEEVDILIKRGYILSEEVPLFATAKDLKLTTKGRELLIPNEKEEQAQKVENWIQDYRNLFKGTKPGAMGDKNACLKKMKKFLIENPEISVKKIFDATESYINSQSYNNFRYMRRADYFIYKDDVNKITTSDLLSRIEEMGEETESRTIDPFRKDA